jgi:uncharacterized membrane-anchored protein YitT (DUF2179 family)
MSKIKTWLIKEKNVIINEFTSEPPRKIVKNVLIIILGSFIFSISDSFFLIPMNIISGGVTSLSIIFHALPGFDILSVQTYVLIITWVFFTLGLFMIGLKYSLKQLVFAVAYPLFDFFFAWLINIVVIDGVHVLDLASFARAINFANGAAISADSDGLMAIAYIIAIVFGGALMGVGIGFTFIGGGSSGGTDVINILANKYTGIRIGTSSFICDMAIIVGGFFVNGYNFLPSLCGILTAFICSYMIDHVYLGNNKYYLAQIISAKWNEINDFINKDLGRGTTLLEGKGGYTHKDLIVVEACFDKQDYALIKQSIYQIDPNAFVMVMSTSEILGYGFSRDKPKVEMKDLAISPDDARKLAARASRKRKRTFYYDEK